MVAGLTGGIGSGKSVVAKLFELLGSCVFNSDQVARSVYFDAAVKPKIIALLGQEAYLSELEINKTYISSKIFSDPELLKQLNAVIHPAVLNSFAAFKETNNGKVIIKETALLFETRQETGMDKVILVAANDNLRMERVMKRDGLTKEEVLKKMNSQLPQEEKIKRSDFVIYNNEEEFLIPQVIDIYNQLTESEIRN